MRDLSLELLRQLVEAVSGSPKYRTIHPDLIRSIGSKELAKGRSPKEAIKATKNKLHQVAGAYLNTEIDYANWIRQLKASRQSGEEEQVRLICRQMMSLHTSTRERLDILQEFYIPLRQIPGEIQTVLDVACGLNPLSIPWMGLPKEAEYLALDVDLALIDFLNSYFSLFKIRGQAIACDVLETCPSPTVDLVLVLKAIPCLEQLDKNAADRLLDRIKGKYMLVSFPARSLGGRNKGMPGNYSVRFESLATSHAWNYKRYQFPSELAYFISTAG